MDWFLYLTIATPLKINNKEAIVKINGSKSCCMKKLTTERIKQVTAKNRRNLNIILDFTFLSPFLWQINSPFIHYKPFLLINLNFNKIISH
jgi:hypothetical protein